VKRSTERILTTHAGSLARPDDLRDLLVARDTGRPYDQAALASRTRSAVAEVVEQIEASNPRHEHEWRVWEDVKLPDGKILIPGVVGHASDFVEHPDLVAERIVRYARLVGRENVIAGTDCGLGPRVGHPKIAWAKFEALVEGARLATRQLWGR